MGTLTETIDLKRYGRLLAKAAPRVIMTEEANARALTIVESLMEKGERNMTPEEDALLDLLTHLIRDFESRAYPPRVIHASPLSTSPIAARTSSAPRRKSGP